MSTKKPGAKGKTATGGNATAAGPGRRRTATDALREEAERNWAEADRTAARGERRTQARAKRRGEARDRDAEIQRLKGKLARAKATRVKPPA